MSKFSAADHFYMQQALKEARRGRFSTSPNPAVGCVIVKDGAIVGSGFHHKAGEGHAEVMALKSAGNNVQGACCYVTLEPCSHYGRTPPCAKALVKAGVSRVVVAIEDPNPKVAGKGIAILQDAGVKVEVGLLESEAYKLNKAFFKSIQGKGPYVVAKVALSLDAKSALANGESKWITNEKSRRFVQKIRARADAIITGVNTVLADDPHLNVRYSELPKKVQKQCYLWNKQPLKVVLDSKGQLLDKLESLNLFKDGQSLIVMTDKERFKNFVFSKLQVEVTQKEDELNLFKINENIEVLLVKGDERGHVSLPEVLKALDKFSIRRVLVEAGATLVSRFIDEKLVDELFVFCAPKLLGQGARDAIITKAKEKLANALEFKLKKVKTLGDDVMLKYERKEGEECLPG